MVSEKVREFVKEVEEMKNILNVNKQRITLDQIIERLMDMEEDAEGEIELDDNSFRELLREVISRGTIGELEYRPEDDELSLFVDNVAEDTYAVINSYLNFDDPNEALLVDQLILGYGKIWSITFSGPDHQLLYVLRRQ